MYWALFFAVHDGNVAIECLNIDSLKTPNILKTKLGKQIPKEGKTVIERLLV